MRFTKNGFEVNVRYSIVITHVNDVCIIREHKGFGFVDFPCLDVSDIPAT